MVPPPRPFVYVYRNFDDFEYDVKKSDALFELRKFDFDYIIGLFPSFVLEREDTRVYDEKRYQIMIEDEGEVFFIVYTMRGKTCRLITAWIADHYEREFYYERSR